MGRVGSILVDNSRYRSTCKQLSLLLTYSSCSRVVPRSIYNLSHIHLISCLYRFFAPADAVVYDINTLPTDIKHRSKNSSCSLFFSLGTLSCAHACGEATYLGHAMISVITLGCCKHACIYYLLRISFYKIPRAHDQLLRFVPCYLAILRLAACFSLNSRRTLVALRLSPTFFFFLPLPLLLNISSPTPPLRRRDSYRSVRWRCTEFS